MHACNVLSHISLCNVHRLIRDDSFHLNLIFANKRLTLNQKLYKSGVISLCRLHRIIWDDTLGTCIKHRFTRPRLIQLCFEQNNNASTSVAHSDLPCPNTSTVPVERLPIELLPFTIICWGIVMLIHNLWKEMSHNFSHKD